MFSGQPAEGSRGRQVAFYIHNQVGLYRIFSMICMDRMTQASRPILNGDELLIVRRSAYRGAFGNEAEQGDLYFGFACGGSSIIKSGEDGNMFSKGGKGT